MSDPGPGSAQVEPRPGYVQLLRDCPGYRLLFAARSVSLLGDWFSMIAIVALLREVERLDPGNEPAKLMLKASAERLASVAQEAYEVGMVDDAKHYLELALTVTPDVGAWRELRSTWEKSVASN